MKKSTHVRLSDLTVRQLAALVAATGNTQTEIIEKAIDRLHQQEINTMTSTELHYQNGQAVSIADDRLANIARLANVTYEQAREFITADWDEGDEHVNWILTASDNEIASWIAAGLK